MIYFTFPSLIHVRYFSDVSYDSDDEPEPTPSQRKSHAPPPKEEDHDDESYGSSSGDEKDSKDAPQGGDPLIIFDPFGEKQGGGGGASSNDPFGVGGFNPNLHQGVDARGQAIPKGLYHFYDTATLLFFNSYLCYVV